MRDEDLYVEYLKVAPVIKVQSFHKYSPYFPVSWGGDTHSFCPTFLICLRESLQLVLYKTCFQQKQIKSIGAGEKCIYSAFQSFYFPLSSLS